jgi:hypothetical protein
MPLPSSLFISEKECHLKFSLVLCTVVALILPHTSVLWKLSSCHVAKLVVELTARDIWV